jgi:hypothetical protein
VRKECDDGSQWLKGRATVRQGGKRGIMNIEREGRNWPFVGPSVCYSDDDRKLRVGGRVRKELAGLVHVLRMTVGMLTPVVGISVSFERVNEGFPRLAQAEAILPVHVVQMQLDLSGLPDLISHVFIVLHPFLVLILICFRCKSLTVKASS